MSYKMMKYAVSGTSDGAIDNIKIVNSREEADQLIHSLMSTDLIDDWYKELKEDKVSFDDIDAMIKWGKDKGLIDNYHYNYRDTERGIHSFVYTAVEVQPDKETDRKLAMFSGLIEWIGEHDDEFIRCAANAAGMTDEEAEKIFGIEPEEDRDI